MFDDFGNDDDLGAIRDNYEQQKRHEYELELQEKSKLKNHIATLDFISNYMQKTPERVAKELFTLSTHRKDDVVNRELPSMMKLFTKFELYEKCAYIRDIFEAINKV